MRANSRHRDFWGSFLRDDRGQSTTEYILILSVVVMIALKFRGIFQGQLNGLMSNLGGQLSSFSDTTGP